MIFQIRARCYLVIHLPKCKGLKWLLFADHSTAGIVVALAILPTGLLWPSLACLPYMLVFLGNIWCWSICSRPRSFSSAALALLQSYTGLMLAAFLQNGSRPA